MDTIPIPRTLEDVARQHGIILSKDDPLRLLEAYCMEVLKNGLKELQSGTTAFFTAAEESLAPLLEEIRSRDRKNTQMVLANLIAAVLVFLAALLVVLV